MKAMIYDFYDDPKGQVITRLLPDGQSIPDFVKQAEAVPRGAHKNQFAVVMLDGEGVHPRYPISDPGNAWLSSLYFLDTHEALPGDVQKVAAARIGRAMESYGMQTPGLIEKIADGEAFEDNVVDVTGRMPTAIVHKGVQDDDARLEAQHALEQADGTKLYKLSNADDAATAARYFDTHKHAFEPRERREFAVKTAAALDKAGLPETENIASYSGEDYSPHLQGYMDVRYAWIVNMDDPDAIEHFHKVAAAKGTVDPETFAQNLERFDRDVGLDAAWDTHIPDPWFSTFFHRPGMTKTAAKESKGVHRVGIDSVLDRDIIHLATNYCGAIEKALGAKVAQSMKKEPVAVFNSLPAPQKKVIARLATEAVSFG
jgi:hypothetical protein